MDMIKRRLPWAVVGIYYLVAGTGIYLLQVAGTTFAEMGIPNAVLVGFYFILGIWVAIGALIARRRPEHPVGWVVSVGLIGPALDVLASGLVSVALRRTTVLSPALTPALVWLNWSAMPFGILIFTLVFALTPDHNFSARGMRRLARLTAGALAIYLGAKVFEPGRLVIMPSLNNPLAADSATWSFLSIVMWSGLGLLLLAYLGSLAALLRRYARSGAVESRQVRWLIPPALLFLFGIPVKLLGEHLPWPALFNLAGTLHMIAVAGMVTAVAIAVLRYHLYDLEIILNRTLVYGVLSSTLGVIYFLVVLVLQQIFPARSQIAIVVSTLTVAALFAPLRRRIQGVIDRQFFRRRYDAAQVVAQFSLSARNQVDLDALSRALLELVETSMEPQNASLWLRQTPSRPAQLNPL